MHVEPVDALKKAVESTCEVALDGDVVVKCVVQGEEDKEEEEEEEEEGEDKARDGCDWRNVEKLSDLFSRMESEHELGADFGVFIEDQDAIHVEEISDIFSALEAANRSSSELDIVLQAEEEDARVVDEFADLFSSLEGSEDADTVDADNVDAMSVLFSELEEQESRESADAEHVDAMSALFSELEGVDTPASAPASGSDQDWIDALEVDNVASLFAELEEAVEAPRPHADAKVDARVFVPTFAVRIEGKPAPGLAHSLMSGPPTLLAGPPLPRVESVGRRREKRKSRSLAVQAADPSISDTRRACAAKRQRVKGRFVAEKRSFVSITSLQQS